MCSLLFGLLFGSSYDAQLKRAHYYCAATQKERIYRGLSEYKSLYIKALIDGDDALKKEALQGLIHCSKRLGLDYSAYEKELGGTSGSSKPRAKKTKPKPKKLALVRNRLERIILHQGYVEFRFAYPLQKSDIDRKVLADRGKGLYKYIFDVRAILATKPRSFRLRSVRAMRVAQFDKEHVRIVFENGKDVSISQKILSTKLLIYLNAKAAQKTKKAVPMPKLVSNASKIIVIDPGHGGKDSGAIGYKRKREKDIVLQIAKKVYTKLKKAGYKVYLTRRGDYFISLRSRTRFANRVKAHLFISIHANAAPKKSKYLSMKGLETFFLSPARSERAKRIAALENRVDMKNMSYYSKKVFLNFINREKTIMSNKLAIDIQRNILYTLRKKFRVVDGGVRPGPFWVLVGAQMPAILVEVGYITNPTEAMRISNPYYQNLIAEGIVRGVESYFLHSEK